MKKTLSLVLFTILALSKADAQSLQFSKKETLSLSSLSKPTISVSKSSPAEAFWLIFPFNPIILVENQKVYFGLTKEFAIGKVGFGHIAAEYSYLFRSENNSHLRFSYNYDIILEAGDLGGFLLSVGGGYFTDFNKKGIFPQVSFNMLLPLYDDVAVMPYIKTRYTFMTDNSQSNIFDFSLGLKTSFYFRL